MPFKKVGRNKNMSPSGKMYTDKQKKMYYATDGFKRKSKRRKKLTKSKMRNEYS